MSARLCAVVLSLAAAASAAAQVPAGPEFRVNTYRTGTQLEPSVSVNGDGSFVAVWRTLESPQAIQGQRISRLGTMLGAEFIVHAGTTNEQLAQPRVASEANGGFTVVWAGYAIDPPRHEVFGRRYDASGAPRGAEFQVNAYTTGRQVLPAIAADPAGGFVVAWMGDGQDDPYFGIFGQRFDAAGNRLGAEFSANSITLGRQYAPALATDGGGNFVVVWRSAVSGNLGSIAGQRFTREGLRIGTEFQVSTYSTGLFAYPAVASTPAGNFVVAWTDTTALPMNVVARRYDATGVPEGAPFIVRTFVEIAGLFEPAVASDAAGRFFVAWEDIDQAEFGLEGRRFDATGAPRGRVLRVNTSTTDNQVLPAVASDPAGNLLIVWSSSHDATAEYDTYAQRYRAVTPRLLDVDPPGGTSANGNRVLEPGEAVEVRPSWQNHTGGALSLAGALSGITGPPGATYGVVDGAGSYGSVPDSATQPCSDCYAVSVSAPAGRPERHWDAKATEVLNADEEGHGEWVLHVGDSFTDVPRTNAFYRFIETLLHHGVSGGCTPTTYCPAAATTREQMAVLLLVAREDDSYVPPFCNSGPFHDVPTSSPFCRWIAELARRGVASGCGGGNYCPTQPVTREQAAVLVLRTLDASLNPPACTTPMFADVPASSPFCRWIEELARRGVVSGCGGGYYCPTAAVTREQMAVFLTGTFGLTLYGP